MMRLWSAHLKDCEFAVMGEVGHSIAYEAPALFNQYVLDFLRRHAD
jgi:pimeloyl-ACP methyl ester carboxylesterase